MGRNGRKVDTVIGACGHFLLSQYSKKQGLEKNIGMRKVIGKLSE